MGSPNQRIDRLPTPPDDSRPTPRNRPSANPPSAAPGAPDLAPTAATSTSFSDYDLYRARAGSSTVGAESPSEETGKTRSLSEAVEKRWEEVDPEEQERYRRKEEEEKAVRGEGERA